jgi:hypothetical protein
MLPDFFGGFHLVFTSNKREKRVKEPPSFALTA